MSVKKIKHLSIYLILLSFCAVISVGCEEFDNEFWEITPYSRSTEIQKEVDGIEFKFCLLNEAGEAATVFNKGENFTFYFSVTNKSNEQLYFLPYFAHFDNNDFCKVYGSNNQDYGRPYYLRGYDKRGPFPFDVEESFVFEQPWADGRDTVWRWKCGYYESSHQEHLEKGSYYTGFKYRFEFERPYGAPTLYTETLTFKINFKIR